MGTMLEVGIYDSSAIWSKELIDASLFPLWASSTERITSLSMLGNMSWIDFRSSSLHRCWGLTAGGGIVTGTMPGLQTAGIPAGKKKKTNRRKKPKHTWVEKIKKCRWFWRRKQLMTWQLFFFLKGNSKKKKNKPKLQRLYPDSLDYCNQKTFFCTRFCPSYVQKC